MKEIVFVVEEDQDGGYSAHALGESIFTQAETREELAQAVRDAVLCHYERDEDRPNLFWFGV